MPADQFDEDYKILCRALLRLARLAGCWGKFYVALST